MPIHAQSISQTVMQWLRRGPAQARILATFEHACDLLSNKGQIIALVSPSVGNGPLNVVLESSIPPFADLERDESVELTEHAITVGSLKVDLRSADVWDPRPDWASLRGNQDRALFRLPALRDLCVRLGPPDSLVPIIAPPAPTVGDNNPFISTLRETIGLLAQGWMQSHRSLREVGHRLTGLGIGLTPSGDDFLVGLMHWAWLSHPEPARFCATMIESTTQTTSLSSALLRTAARGECIEAWHDLLIALNGEKESGIETAVRAILAHGATSGADALTGFVWSGLQSAGLN